ncbi:hypothetical protein THAR02_10616 [Trichoderma harzianum]|uniref:Uncharacterized protein n=1 Tax=Trichoderma harzianum TaxID=5544 RepID=A0A0F9WXV1_TRIHA|nr:hypothetical protein THAR02_10616 [Trichoderma harzianum]
MIIDRNLGRGTSMFLEPFLLFKGKLRAADTRAKFHDSADLRMLGGKFEDVIKPRANQVSLEYVGLAMKLYGVLENLFRRLNIDVDRAKQVVQSYDLEDVPPPAVGDVQRGLLA